MLFKDTKELCRHQDVNLTHYKIRVKRNIMTSQAKGNYRTHIK